MQIKFRKFLIIIKNIFNNIYLTVISTQIFHICKERRIKKSLFLIF